MYHHALTGGRTYWTWIAALVALIGLGVFAWLHQLEVGLAVTGLGRDVSWGLYIAQFTFLVGVAASAVTVVLPCYLHDFRQFGRVTVLGELLAVAAVTCAVLFIVVDMGQPGRVLNVILYPRPGSLMFWDMLALGGYLLLNVLIARSTLSAERHDVPPPAWTRALVIVSIPWAISIHTVTAFLYSGLPGRTFWLTALLAPRFLASAFATGPALLILVALLLRRIARYDVGEAAIRTLALIVTYAMVAHAFFLAVEVFTALYSQIPEHVRHFRYLFVGVDGHAAYVPWMWASVALAVISLILLLVPRFRRRPALLVAAAAAVICSLWIDKGLGLIVGGFVPSPVDAVTDYVPSRIESEIAVGVWAVGTLMLTVFYKIVLGVRGRADTRHRSRPGPHVSTVGVGTTDAGVNACSN